jgi:hypothetical protein
VLFKVVFVLERNLGLVFAVEIRRLGRAGWLKGKKVAVSASLWLAKWNSQLHDKPRTKNLCVTLLCFTWSTGMWL